MKLVGFGCSFTYGSELQSPNIDPNDHWANTRYRNEHCWLGLLAKYFNCEYDNKGEPANSNYAIQYQFADWFNNNRNPNEQVVVCIGWTEPARFSWLDETWTHNGTVRNDQKFLHSRSDWLKSKVDHEYWTDAAKLFVNAVCNQYRIPILQFNAIGKHSVAKYNNYFLDGGTMQSVLEKEHLAPGGHPNELGHEWFTKRLYLFAKERIIL